MLHSVQTGSMFSVVVWAERYSAGPDVIGLLAKDARS